jgi:hypothetical protein
MQHRVNQTATGALLLRFAPAKHRSLALQLLDACAQLLPLHGQDSSHCIVAAANSGGGG